MREIAVSVDGDLKISIPFEYRHIAKRIGARWEQRSKCWKMPKSARSIERIREAFPEPIHLDSECESILDMDRKAAEAKESNHLPPIPGCKTPPWKHQLQAYHFAMHHPCAAMLAHGMGAGKSLTTTQIAINRKSASTLILCPTSVISAWVKQFRIHTNASIIHYLSARKTSAYTSEHPQCRVVAVEKGIPVKVKKEILELESNTHLPTVLVINYESARCEPLAGWFLSSDWDMVVCDEIHRIKSAGSSISKFCAKLGKKAAFRLGLTGTPMAHSPLDVYGQYRFLDPSIFGTSYVAFRSRYAVMGGFGNHQVLKYQHEEELNAKFRSLAHVVGREVLDLPEATHTDMEFSLSHKAQSIYDDLENALYASVDSGEITAANAMTKLLRLQQITGGYCKTDDGEEIEIGDTGKADLLSDILEDIDPNEPVIVFTRFTHDLDVVRRVSAKSGRSHMELSGRCNQLTDWQDGKANVLAVQIQSGGIGVDFTRSRYCIYYSLGFSLGDYEQSLARVHRPGQHRPVSYYHLIARGTVDRKVYDAISAKRDVIDYVLSCGRECRS
jgi:SNF2 family DNA or RNA helicase